LHVVFPETPGYMDIDGLTAFLTCLFKLQRYCAALVSGDVNAAGAAGAAGAVTLLFGKIDMALHCIRADALLSIDTNTNQSPAMSRYMVRFSLKSSTSPLPFMAQFDGVSITSSCQPVGVLRLISSMAFHLCG
jgi:hypothetical protein